MRASGRGALWLLVVATAVLAAFPDVLSPRTVFFQRDIQSYWYPMVATFVRVLGQGEMPLWDPFEAYGLPLWSDPGGQTAYPPTWLNVLLLPHVVYKILVIGHLIWAGAGAFLLVRRWGLGRLPAVVAGVTFACSGPLVSAASLIHHLCGATWLPWVLWAFEGVIERGTARRIGILAAVLGGQALAGSAEMCAMGGLAALIRFVALVLSRRGQALARLPAILGAAAAAFLVAALQWIPTMAVIGRSNRAGFTAEQSLFWSVHPATLVDALVPRLLSEMAMSLDARLVLFSGREPFLVSIYLGVAVLPLALLAFRSQRPCRGWVIAAFAFFALVSLGRYFPPARLVLATPPLSLFRYPAKYFLPTALFWALLAALGTEVWSRAWNRQDRVYAWSVGAAVAALAAALAFGAWRFTVAPGPMIDAFGVPDTFRAWMGVLAARKLTAAALWTAAAAVLALVRAWRPEWSRATCALVALAAGADVVRAARPVNLLAPIELLAHRPPALDSLPPPSAQARLLSIGTSLTELNQTLVRGPANWEPEWRWALGIQEMIGAPSGTRWGLRGAYDADFTGLAPTALPFMSRLVRYLEGSPVGVRLLQMGNVEWVLDARPTGFPVLEERRRYQTVFADPLRLLHVPDPLPPAYLVGGASRAATDEDAMRRISSPAFDPRTEAVLAGPGASGPQPDGFRGEARYVVRDANRLQLDTESTGPGVLVVVETYDPDWRATLDGVPVPVERANVLFRGVRVPAGRHRVELRYFPRAVAWGLAMGAAGVAVIAFLLRPRSG